MQGWTDLMMVGWGKGRRENRQRRGLADGKKEQSRPTLTKGMMNWRNTRTRTEERTRGGQTLVRKKSGWKKGMKGRWMDGKQEPA